MPDRRVVLLVEPRASDRDRLGQWLEEAGFDVTLCSGPSSPDYACVGARGLGCPLVEEADAIVLDLSLPGDDVGMGAGAAELLTYYLTCDKPVVGLVRNADLLALHDEAVRSLRWPTDARELAAAVSAALGTPAG